MMVLGGFVGVMALGALMSCSYGDQASLRRRGQGQRYGEKDEAQY